MTISDHVRGISEGGSLGRPSVLTAAVEEEIADKIKAAALTGWQHFPYGDSQGKTPKCLQAYNTPAGVPGTAYTYQSRAWMEDALGEGWFEAHFLKHCGPERPQLIVLDSHSSHETLGLLEKAKANDVTILAFPPHTTQWLCPLDKSVFGPLSWEWNRVCSEFMVQSPNNLVTKWEWPHLFKQAYSVAFTPSNVCSGFRKCGIFPVNRNSIPDKAFVPSKPFDISLDSSREGGVADVPVVVEADNPVTSDTVTPDAGVSATPIAGTSVVPSTTEAVLPEGASLLSDTDFILSVLTGDTPCSFDESGNLVVEMATVSEAAAMDAIKSEFSLPAPVTKQSLKSNPRKLTSHRIFTSDEIIKMKVEKRDEKEKLEREKQARLEARQYRQKGGKSASKSNVNT
ncbi:MFS-type transporter clz9-like [Haliotis rubra]|uniref:MFS-type transporter clz9-like n=1 Tax=Haliotis rubra TaxID=36100 RepID=UPI001EE53671|nr:MFS-type transporter clz9-like [Haliotis rubra]